MARTLLIAGMFLAVSFVDGNSAPAGILRHRGRARYATGPSAADASLEAPPLKVASLDNIGLSLSIDRRDAQGRPRQICVQFINRTDKTLLFMLPRPAVEEVSYTETLPSIAIGMREADKDPLRAGEPCMLYATGQGRGPEPQRGVVLRPHGHTTQRYDLAMFCLIGHGIGPDPAANFSACFKPGDKKYLMQIYMIVDWSGGELKMSGSNAVAVQLSVPDFSIHKAFSGAIEPRDEK